MVVASCDPSLLPAKRRAAVPKLNVVGSNPNIPLHRNPRGFVGVRAVFAPRNHASFDHMSIVRARVRDGHIVVDEPTDLPEGMELTVAVLDGDDEMSDSERVELEATIDQGRADIAAGRGVSAEDFLSRLRTP